MRSVLLPALLLAVSGCADACDCGGDGAPEVAAPVTSARAPGQPSGAVGAGRGDAGPRRDPGANLPWAREPGFRAVDAGVAPGSREDRDGDHFARLQSPELPRLRALQKALRDAPVKAAAPVAADLLDPVLPEALLQFRASGPIQAGPAQVGGGPVKIRSREYRSGEQELYVKVTDTGAVPALREDYIRRLTLRGDALVGGLRPAYVGPHAVLDGAFVGREASFTTGLLGGRFLVEIRTRLVKDPAAARRAFAALDLSALVE